MDLDQALTRRWTAETFEAFVRDRLLKGARDDIVVALAAMQIQALRAGAGETARLVERVESLRNDVRFAQDRLRFAEQTATSAFSRAIRDTQRIDRLEDRLHERLLKGP